MLSEGQDIIYVVLFLKRSNKIKPWGNNQTSIKWRRFYNAASLYFSKLPWMTTNKEGTSNIMATKESCLLNAMWEIGLNPGLGKTKIGYEVLYSAGQWNLNINYIPDIYIVSMLNFLSLIITKSLFFENACWGI